MTDAELAILSLLAESANYDHALNDLIQVRGLRRWTAIGSSSMYYVLDKLEKQGLIQKEVEEDGRRRFRISSAGTGVLQTAVVDLLSTPHLQERSFELGLANLHVLRSSQVRSALLSRQQDIIAQLTRLRQTLEQERASDDSFQVIGLFSHRIHILEAELVWLDKFIGEWEAQAIPDPETVIEPVIIPRARQVVLPQDPDSIHKQETRHVASDKKSTPVAKRTNINRVGPSIPPENPADARSENLDDDSQKTH